MSDVSRKVVPDKRSLNRERPVTKAPKFSSCTSVFCFVLFFSRFFFSPYEPWNRVCEECIQRDTMTGMVAERDR